MCAYVRVWVCAAPLILQAPHGQVLCFIHLRIRNAQCLTFSGAQITCDGEGRRATWLPGSSTPGRCRGVPSPPQPFPILKGGLPPSCGFPGGSGGEESACNAGESGSMPGGGRSPGEGNGNPLQSSAWKIPWSEEPGGLQSMGSQRVRHD